jgi:hypothetical protein
MTESSGAPRMTGIINEPGITIATGSTLPRIAPEAFSLVKSEIPDLVRDYIIWVETAETANLCSCEYIIHPDDTEKPEGSRRMRRIGAPAFDCMAHSREGLVMGFFTWAFMIRHGKAEFRTREPKQLNVVVQTTQERLTKLREDGAKTIINLDDHAHFECGYSYGPTMWDPDPKAAWCRYRRTSKDAACNRRIHFIADGYICEGGHALSDATDKGPHAQAI